MNRKIYKYLVVTLSITCILLGLVSSYILKIADNADARERSFRVITQIEDLMDEKQEELQDVLTQINKDNLAKAKAIALILNQSQNSFQNPESLESLRIAMEVEEIIITNKDGIVINATTPFVGDNLFLDLKYQPFKEAVNSKTFTLVQNDIVNSEIRQYIGVSRLEEDGLVYVETISKHLGNVIRLSGVSTLCENKTVMTDGNAYIIDKNQWIYVSHTNMTNVGEFFQIPKEKYKNLDTSGEGLFTTKIKGEKNKVYYRVKDDYVICTMIPTDSIYKISTFATVAVVISILLTSFVAILAIRKKLIDYKIN